MSTVHEQVQKARDLAPLENEVLLCRQYLDLEKLRLGERLIVDWNVKSMPGDALVPKLPVVVLVDDGSASASEIVTGALRDRKRATVVGTHTFGKGLVQEVETLSNGGVLDLTVANYYLPGGKTISKGGLKPQVPARDDPKTRRDEALPKALATLLQKIR